jgi:protein-S-isoprenylcysteine O-methyltransferase Ste14
MRALETVPESGTPEPAGVGPASRDARPTPDRTGPEARIGDLAARGVVAGLFLVFSIRIAADFMATGRITGLLLLASESLVVVLMLARRRALVIDRRWQAAVVAAASIVGPTLLRPVAEGAGLPDRYAATVSGFGLLLVVLGKMSLGRSFGIMPAHRGLVSSGLYRWVRHPIYLGYLITHLAFLAQHPSAWNLAALAVADLALVRRTTHEERTLSGDAEYVAYLDRVRWRLVPGVY